jgi:hypothetical protein
VDQNGQAPLGAGLVDDARPSGFRHSIRHSRPSSPFRGPRKELANRTNRRIEAIAALRRLQITGAEMAEALDMALSTVSGILTQIGMGNLGQLGLKPAEALRTRADRRAGAIGRVRVGKDAH